MPQFPYDKELKETKFPFVFSISEFVTFPQLLEVLEDSLAHVHLVIEIKDWCEQ